MAYEDDSSMDLDRDLYEDEVNEPQPDTYFGERLGETDSVLDDSDTDSDMSMEEYEETDSVETEPGFGESLNPSQDDASTADASADQASEEPVGQDEHESLLDKAKGKIDDLTSSDE
jgi:hypothetical protein